MSSVIDEILELLERYDLEIEKKRSSIKALHHDLPVYLIVKLSTPKNQATIEIEPDEELSDTLADLIESGEDVEDLVDNVLSELRDAAIEVSRILSDKGFKVSLKIREGERDVRDQLEEVVEEYAEIEEE